MARSVIYWSTAVSHPQFNFDSYRGFFFIPITLAFVTCILIFSYISSTSKLLIHPQNQALHHTEQPLSVLVFTPRQPAAAAAAVVNVEYHEQQLNLSSSHVTPTWELDNVGGGLLEETSPPPAVLKAGETSSVAANIIAREASHDQSQWPPGILFQVNKGKNVDKRDVFHDRTHFLEDYKEMNRSLKIYVYPHNKNDPFANVLLPVKDEPGGNYASESYFKKALFKSHFITRDPSKADLFFLPFSIAGLRHDPRVGVGGIQDFVKNYILNISHSYPYWNRTGGADHFYVACHSVGRSAMEKAAQVKLNAIQVVCSSSYFLPGYISHKDSSIPQIWPRKGNPPNRPPSKRNKLAFYAGAMNSRVRQFLVKEWGNDSEMSVHRSRLKTPYSEALLGSKFCIHAKGFEVNTARIGDALYYGCVPVILADYYDLPFADILNWDSFSVVVSTVDIPFLKKILQQMVSSRDYLRLQENVLEVQKHFQWYETPLDYDAFHMVMYELWIRRNHIRIAETFS